MYSPTVILPEHVREDIRRIVAASSNDETGVSLFGVAVGACRVVLAAVGPGPRATHTPVYYEPDVDYANAAFDALKSALPGISWIGEFHVHPRGMPWLSGHDRETMRWLLADTELDLTDFVAGIMQRQDRDVAIYPYYFSRDVTDGQAALLEVVGSAADIVREARFLALQDVSDAPRCERLHKCQDHDEPVRQGWLARVVTIFRRKSDDKQSALDG